MTPSDSRGVIPDDRRGVSPEASRSVTLADIGALFLDVGGTLVHPRRGVAGAYHAIAKDVAGFALPADVDVASVGRAFGRAFHRRRAEARAAGRLAYGTTEEGARRFWRALVGEVFAAWIDDAATLDAVFERLFAWFTQPEAWAVYPDALPLLDAARQRGLPTVVVSNWDARLDVVLRVTGLTPYMDAVVGSYAVGAEKPDRRIFTAALAALPEPVPPAAVLHVGDTPEEDVAGARAAGLRAVLVDRDGSHPAAPDRIPSLEALLEGGR